jgi:hypothetical protein
VRFHFLAHLLGKIGSELANSEKIGVLRNS